MKAATGAGEFPWDAVMALGFGRLRLSSRDFWAMTPREIERAMRVHGRAETGAPFRGDLNRLMATFPDKGSI